jgi:ParB/RepB/Spo0J family partition protein
MHNQVSEIHIDEFDLSLSQMRVISMGRILQVEKSMRLHGQLQPVVARTHEGGIQLIDGFKRVYACENLLIESLQCLLLEIDEDQGKVLLLSYNWSSRSLESYEEARVIQSHSLTSRQSDQLVDAYLAAEDEQSQQLLLKDPLKALYRCHANEPPVGGYDSRLSGYGNQLANAMGEVIARMQDLVRLLEDPGMGSLPESEQLLLFPAVEIIQDGVVAIKQASCHLQIHKTQNTAQK